MLDRGLEEYLSRDWDAVRALKDAYWADRIRALGPREGLRIADELRRQVLQNDPDWPAADERDGDLAAHRRLVELLHRADHARSG